MFLGGCRSRAGCVTYFHFNLFRFFLLFCQRTHQLHRTWECGKGNAPPGDGGAGLDGGQGLRDGLELLGWAVYKAYVGVIGWLKTTTGSNRIWRSCQKAHYCKWMTAMRATTHYSDLCTSVYKSHVLGTRRVCAVVPFIRIIIFLFFFIVYIDRESSPDVELSRSSTFWTSLEFRIFNLKVNIRHIQNVVELLSTLTYSFIAPIFKPKSLTLFKLNSTLYKCSPFTAHGIANPTTETL